MLKGKTLKMSPIHFFIFIVYSAYLPTFSFFSLCFLQVSITFDPFLYLPVPLPQKQKVLSVYYFAKEPHKKPIKVGMHLNSHEKM